jgi:hypothetical protein
VNNRGNRRQQANCLLSHWFSQGKFLIPTHVLAPMRYLCQEIENYFPAVITSNIRSNFLSVGQARASGRTMWWPVEEPGYLDASCSADYYGWDGSVI